MHSGDYIWGCCLQWTALATIISDCGKVGVENWDKGVSNDQRPRRLP